MTNTAKWVADTLWVWNATDEELLLPSNFHKRVRTYMLRYRNFDRIDVRMGSSPGAISATSPEVFRSAWNAILAGARVASANRVPDSAAVRHVFQRLTDDRDFEIDLSIPPALWVIEDFRYGRSPAIEFTRRGGVDDLDTMVIYEFHCRRRNQRYSIVRNRVFTDYERI